MGWKGQQKSNCFGVEQDILAAFVGRIDEFEREPAGGHDGHVRQVAVPVLVGEQVPLVDARRRRRAHRRRGRRRRRDALPRRADPDRRCRQQQRRDHHRKCRATTVAHARTGRRLPPPVATADRLTKQHVSIRFFDLVQL